MKTNALRPLRILFFLFTTITLICIAGRVWLQSQGIDAILVLCANLLFFMVHGGSFLLLSKSLQQENPRAFVRAMMAGFMFRFFLVAIAAFVYIMIQKKNINKPGLFISAGLYLLYILAETTLLVRLLKSKKHAC